jgi:hypothetical protein
MKIVDRIASLVDLLRRRKKTSTQRVAIARLERFALPAVTLLRAEDRDHNRGCTLVAHGKRAGTSTMRALVWRASIAALGLASAACAQGMDGNTLDTAARSGALASRRASAGAEHTIVVTDRDDGPRLPRPALSCAIDRRPEWFSPPGLNAELAHTARVLLDLGLPDPRGLPLVTALAYPGRFDGVERATSMVGWLVAARDRSPAMLLALRGDLVEIEAEHSPLARIERSSIEPSDSWTAMQQHRAAGIVRHNYVSAALLALSGDVREANALWARLWPRGQSKSRAAVREFAELYFDSALGGFHAGRSAAPQSMTRALECARPHIEQNAEELTTTTVEGGAQRVTAERATAFLSAVPTLVDELRRRAAEPRATLTEAQLATAPIAALVAQLDGVALRFDGWTLSFEGEPLLVALRARGAAAAPEIIDAFERDGRWTRTIQHGSDPLRRSVVSVRALLAWLVTEHTGMRPEEFGWTSFSDPRDARPSEVAQTLRERWSTLRNLAPFDRAVAALTDTNANFVRQIASVAWLFRPRPGEPSTPVLLRGSGPRVIDRFAVEGPALTEAQRERLAQTLLLRAPGLGPLRDASAVALAEEDRRCAYAQASYLVSPTRSLTFVQQTLERAYAREPNAVSPSCAAWLSAALVANGDRAAAEEVARRVRTLPWREAAITRIAHWWGGAREQRRRARRVGGPRAEHRRRGQVQGADRPWTRGDSRRAEPAVGDRRAAAAGQTAARSGAAAARRREDARAHSIRPGLDRGAVLEPARRAHADVRASR